MDELEVSNVKLINASGVFFHLEELHSVIRGIVKALRDDGVFVVQFMYLGDMLKKLSFDGIYHEHLCYYSIRSLINLLEPYGLHLFDGYHVDIHGGSIVAKFSKQELTPSEKIVDLLAKEADIVNIEKLDEFSKSVQKWKTNFTKDVLALKEQGKKIYAFGAPAKGNTLLTYCGLDHTVIDCVFEVNDMKCGLYTPVTHIPIVKENHELIEDNSCIILLSWNFCDEIINNCKDLTERGVTFIIPFTGLEVE